MADMSWNLMGHEWAVAMLQQQIASGNLRHAYLFSGSKGVGRRSLALHFAQAINCPEAETPGQPCLHCHTCEQIGHMQHTDLDVVQNEQEGDILKVDAIRTLQHALALAPYGSGKRIALLLRFEEANANAQNALLKTLEEPNPRVVLLLTVDDAENLHPTIPSRCEHLRLRPITVDKLAGELVQRKGLPADEADLIAHIAGGRPGYALRLIEDPSLLERRADWLDTLGALLASSRRERILFSDKRNRNRDRGEVKQEMYEAFGTWLLFWRDVLLAASGSDVPFTNPDRREEIIQLAESVGKSGAARLTSALERATARLNHANLQVLLDNILLGWPHR
jgi:DNA polymerase-3 subunit delta'